MDGACGCAYSSEIYNYIRSCFPGRSHPYTLALGITFHCTVRFTTTRHWLPTMPSSISAVAARDKFVTLLSSVDKNLPTKLLCFPTACDSPGNEHWRRLISTAARPRIAIDRTQTKMASVLLSLLRFRRPPRSLHRFILFRSSIDWRRGDSCPLVYFCTIYLHSLWIDEIPALRNSPG